MKTKIQKIIFSVSTIVLMPSMVLADTVSINPSLCPGNFNDVRGILNWFTCLLIDSIVPLLMAVALVLFIYGVVQYIFNANDSALFVISSVWGLVKLLATTFGIGFAIPQLMQ
jgi:hypothetical protein